MSDVLLSLLMAAHLLSVNIAAAAPMIAIWHEWKEWRGDSVAGRAGRALLCYAIVGTLLGALLGLIAGWLLWDDGLATVVKRLPSKVYYGVWELAFSLMLTIVHWAWWRAAPRSGAWQRGTRSFLALLAGTNLIYHFPVLFAVMTEIIHRGELAGTVIDSSAFRGELVRGAVLARSLHFLFAAVATCGIVLMLYGQTRLSGEPREERDRVARWGARWALAATIAQIPGGIWLLTRLSSSAQNRILGGDLWVTGVFAMALITALWLAHVLASIALGDTNRRLVYRSALLFAIVVWLMTGVSRRALAPISAGNHYETRQNCSLA